MAAPRAALRTSLQAGALYDLAVGAVLLAAGERVFAALGFELRSDPFLLRLASLPLFVLPALYATAARSPHVDAFRPAVLAARGGGGLLILALTALYRPPAAPVYAAIGVIDAGWALLHFVLWKR